MDFAGLQNFLLTIIAVGAAAPLGLWLLAAGIKKLLLRLSPPVEIPSAVVCKRMEVKAKDSNKKPYTVYYMTFEGETGRTEYETPSKAFALAAPGDEGALTLQMGKFIKFDIKK